MKYILYKLYSRKISLEVLSSDPRLANLIFICLTMKPLDHSSKETHSDAKNYNNRLMLLASYVMEMEMITIFRKLQLK